MEYVYIGKIVSTHGIKGELRIKSNFDKKEVVFKPNFNLYIGENHLCEKIVTYRKHKEFDMVTFQGYDNINQVLKYMKLNVYAKREDLNLNNGDYCLQDLIGLNIIEDGKTLGKVSEIVYNGSNILLQIEATKNFYIPVHGNFIKKVNLENRLIEVENAKGLIL